MKTLEYLSGPVADVYWPGVVTLLVVAAVCSLLSVVVVLKRLAFVGQGVSHAGFGGVGLAAAFGVSSSVPARLSMTLDQTLLFGLFGLIGAQPLENRHRRAAVRNPEKQHAHGFITTSSTVVGEQLANQIPHDFRRKHISAAKSGASQLEHLFTTGAVIG